VLAGGDAVSGFTVPNAVGLAAMHEGARRRKRQRDLGQCCRDGSCDTCATEAEAIKAARDE
jgi:hypothetical protein